MRRVRRICALLEGAYGHPECTPVREPLDELVATILSQNTSSANSGRAFRSLRDRFESWDEVRRAHTREIEDAIRVGGLGRIKAGRIKRLFEEVYRLRGSLALGFLADMPDHDARAFLMQFEGVGVKTASCVLMFSLCRPVFPVDTHVHRVTQRLGFIGSSVSAEAAHEMLQRMIPDEMVYSVHVNLVTHGRRVCKAGSPDCDVCVLLELCSYGQNVLASRGA